MQLMERGSKLLVIVYSAEVFNSNRDIDILQTFIAYLCTAAPLNIKINREATGMDGGHPSLGLIQMGES